MMLTDKDLLPLLPDSCLIGGTDSWCISFDDANAIARAVIAANNAKVLAELKPVAWLVGAKQWVYFDKTRAEDEAKFSGEIAHPTYSAETVSALIQDRDSLAARVKELERERDDYERRWQAERRIVESSISGGRYPDGYPAY